MRGAPRQEAGRRPFGGCFRTTNSWGFPSEKAAEIPHETRPHYRRLDRHRAGGGAGLRRTRRSCLRQCYVRGILENLPATLPSTRRSPWRRKLETRTVWRWRFTLARSLVTSSVIQRRSKARVRLNPTPCDTAGLCSFPAAGDDLSRVGKRHVRPNGASHLTD